MTLSLPAGASLARLADSVDVLQLDSPLFSARIALLGGQLIDFTPTGDRPWLYLSPKAAFQPGKAIRGGAPLCWPWFGPHPQDSAQPAHGVARSQAWRLDTVAREGEAFHVELSGPRHAGLAAVMRYRLAPDGVDMTLTTRNHSTADLAFSAALHTYLAVSDIAGITLGGLENAPCHDKLSDTRATLPAGPLRFDGERDAIVYSTQDVSLDDAGWARRLLVSRTGSASVVVWNPWQDKTARLGDLPADGWRHFVCVEAANAGDDSRTLAPGGCHQLVCRLRKG